MKASLLFLLVGCLSIMVGCAGITIPEGAVKSITQYKCLQQQEGLAIAVDPFLEEERLKEFFGIDLLSKGILPILVVAENLHLKSSYLLETQSFSIAIKAEEQTDHKETINPSVSVPKGVETFDTVGVIGLSTTAIVAPAIAIMSLPVLLPLGLHTDKIRADIKSVNENMRKKAFVDRTIFPGESISGFIYFEIKDRESAKKVDRVLVKAKTILSDKDLDFVIRIKE